MNVRINSLSLKLSLFFENEEEEEEERGERDGIHTLYRK